MACRVGAAGAGGCDGVFGAVDEEQLSAALTSAVAGHEAGFAALWRALHPALLRYLRLLVGEVSVVGVGVGVGVGVEPEPRQVWVRLKNVALVSPLTVAEPSSSVQPSGSCTHALLAPLLVIASG